MYSYHVHNQCIIKKGDKMYQKDKWDICASKLICVALVLIGTYVLFKYGISVIIPFLTAWLIGVLISSLAKRSTKAFRGRQRCWSIFYIILFWGFAFLGVLALSIRLAAQASDFFSVIAENGEKISNRLQETVDAIASIPSKIPFLKGISLGGIGEYIKNATSSILESLAKQGGSFVALSIGKLALNTPKALISVLVCIISSIYIGLDYEKIKAYVKNVLVAHTSLKTQKILGQVTGGLRQYLKAYLFVFALTFIELYVGLLVLGRKYALLIAFLIAAFDILPLFGAGTVLIPWGIILIVGGNISVGVGMLILLGIMTVVRQVVEPHLVGRHLGIHPLASLVSVYVGFRVFGFFGMLIAPLVTLVIKEILKGGENNKKIEEKT